MKRALRVSIRGTATPSHGAVQSGTPSLSTYRCVCDGYVEYVPLKSNATWDDRRSGAYADFAGYDIQTSSSVINNENKKRSFETKSVEKKFMGNSLFV